MRPGYGSDMAEQLSGPRVLALVGDMTGPTLWRILQPFTAMQKLGYRADWDHKDAAGIGAIAPAYDGYVLPRMSWAPSARRLAERWFSALRAAGRFVVYDLDDDLLTAQLTQRTVELGWAQGRPLAELEAERFERIWAMQQCDGVTVSTQALATLVRSYTAAPVVVVPNAIDVRWFRGVLRKTPRDDSAPTIGWAGGRRPDGDVKAMAVAWGRIARRYPDVRFVVQGHLPDSIVAAVPEERLAYLPWAPLESYPAGLRGVDIGCAAVEDTRFNACKSPIKAYEYAVADAAVVATPTIYGKLIEDGVTGYLAETADDWEAALAELIERPAQRAMVARRLLRHVERHCSLDGQLWRWPDAWATIAESARARRGMLVTP
jgi:glycosyltransferase involved in cell wall biosynthesis